MAMRATIERVAVCYLLMPRYAAAAAYFLIFVADAYAAPCFITHFATFIYFT